MNWLLSQPLVLIVAAIVVQVVLFGVLQQTGRRETLWVMLGLGALSLGLIVLERLVVTPEEAVTATLHAIASAAENNDVEAVVAHISHRDPQLQDAARTMLRPFKLESVKIKKISELTTHVDQTPPTAEAIVRVLAIGGDRMGTIQHQRALREFRVRFVEEDGRWKVRGYEEVEVQVFN